MQKCEKVKDRKTTNLTSGYRYGCDICTESVLLKENDDGGVEMIPACTSETYGKLFCPHNKCPYAEEIEVHSKRHYDEYDKYVIAKWRKKSFSLF